MKNFFFGCFAFCFYYLIFLALSFLFSILGFHQWFYFLFNFIIFFSIFAFFSLSLKRNSFIIDMNNTIFFIFFLIGNFFYNFLICMRTFFIFFLRIFMNISISIPFSFKIFVFSYFLNLYDKFIFLYGVVVFIIINFFKYFFCFNYINFPLILNNEIFSIAFSFFSKSKNLRGRQYKNLYDRISSDKCSSFVDYSAGIYIKGFVTSKEYSVLYNRVRYSVQRDLNKNISALNFSLFFRLIKSIIKIFKLDPLKVEDCYLLEYCFWDFIIKEKLDFGGLFPGFLLYSKGSKEFGNFKYYFGGLKKNCLLDRAIVKEIDLCIEDISKNLVQATEETAEEFNKRVASVAKFINNSKSIYRIETYEVEMRRSRGSSGRSSPSFNIILEFCSLFQAYYEDERFVHQDVDYVCLVSLISNVLFLYREFLFSYREELKSSKFVDIIIHQVFFFILSRELRSGIGKIFFDESLLRSYILECSIILGRCGAPKASPNYCLGRSDPHYMSLEKFYEMFNEECVFIKGEKRSIKRASQLVNNRVQFIPDSAKFKVVRRNFFHEGISSICFLNFKVGSVLYFVGNKFIYNKSTFFWIFRNIWRFHFCFILYPFLFFDMAQIGSRRRKSNIIKGPLDYKRFSLPFNSMEFYFFNSKLAKMNSFFERYGYLFISKRGRVKDLEVSFIGLEVVRRWRNNWLKKKKG